MRYEVNKVYSYSELGGRAQSALRRKVKQLASSGVPVPEAEKLDVKFAGIWPSSRRHSGGPMFNILHGDSRIATSFIASPVI
jgi:hypothetical protein